MKKEHERRDWKFQQEQQLLEAKYRKHMARQKPLNSLDSQGKGKDEDPAIAYSPEMGFVVYFDFVLGLPAKVQEQVQIVYGFFDQSRALNQPKSLPLVRRLTRVFGVSPHGNAPAPLSVAHIQAPQPPSLPQVRIPRDEARTIGDTVAAAAAATEAGAEAMTCGSYRRGAESCGDVDVLIFPPPVRLWPAWKCYCHPCICSHPGTPTLSVAVKVSLLLVRLDASFLSHPGSSTPSWPSFRCACGPPGSFSSALVLAHIPFLPRPFPPNVSRSL